MDFLSLIKNTFVTVGVISTVLAGHELFGKFLAWKRVRKDLRQKIELLEFADYFIAHIIHLGGEFSIIHSLQVYSDEEGGYYFNPPKDFVSVSFNRGGDSAVVIPTELSAKFNFVIDSVAGFDQRFIKTTRNDICHLPQPAIKNEHFVKFVKSKK